MGLMMYLGTLETEPTCDYDFSTGFVKCGFDKSIFEDYMASCDAQGGEIEDLLLMIGLDGSCSEDGSTGNPPIAYTLPICIAEQCDYTTAFVTVNYMVKMMGEGSAEPCIIDEAKAEGTTGLQCFEGTLDLYGTELTVAGSDISVVVTNTTELTPYGPAVALDEFPEEFCDMDVDESGIKYVCDLSTIGEASDPPVDIQAVCEENGGRFEDLHLFGKMYDPEERVNIEMELHHYPYCIHDSCAEGEGVEYGDFLIELAAEIDIDTVLHEEEDHCDEDMNDMFYLRLKDGEPFEKRCKWLRRRPLEKRMKICARDNYPDGAVPAYEACPTTCCECGEDPQNMFLKKKQKIDGVMTPFPATCAWLSRLPMGKRKKYCKKNGRDFDLPNASSACPETCGVCMPDM